MYKNLNHYRYTVHRYLDGIWIIGYNAKNTRTRMYNILANRMGIERELCHVSMFDRKQCKQAIKILRPMYIQLYGRDLERKPKKKKKGDKNLQTISRTEYFEAAHLLPGYEGGCRNLHGHSYKFTATVTGPKTEPFGMIMDYSDLKKAMKAIMPDHKYLHFSGNEISEEIVSILNKYGLEFMTFPECTTAENMAPYLADILQNYITNEMGYKDIKVVKVELYETVNSQSEVNL